MRKIVRSSSSDFKELRNFSEIPGARVIVINRLLYESICSEWVINRNLPLERTRPRLYFHYKFSQHCFPSKIPFQFFTSAARGRDRNVGL